MTEEFTYRAQLGPRRGKGYLHNYSHNAITYGIMKVFVGVVENSSRTRSLSTHHTRLWLIASGGKSRSANSTKLPVSETAAIEQREAVAFPIRLPPESVAPVSIQSKTQSINATFLEFGDHANGGTKL